MNGWRCRIGLIVPSSNSVNEPEFDARVPPGVSAHTSRMHHTKTSVENQSAMAEKGRRCAELLSTVEPDVVAFGCTTGSLVTGEARYALEMEADLAAAAGVPVVVTAAAVLRAFAALDVDAVAVHTPYPEEMNEREAAFIEDAGVDVLGINGLGLSSTTAKGEVPPEKVYRHARATDESAADAVFISCTNYRTFEVVERLEADLGKPVVTSNQATLWNALSVGGVGDAAVELGRLFEHDVPELDVAPEATPADD